MSTPQLNSDLEISTVETDRGQAPWLTWQSQNRSPKDIIHLSPANGLPTACYDEFISHFLADYEVTGMDNRGAWLNEPEPDERWNWLDHADDLIAAIQAKHTTPVIGLGHSIGGTVTLLAAAKRPELFSKLVIVDAASVPSKMISQIYRFIPQWLSFRLFKFIKGSHQRQRSWPSPEAFFERYRNHPTYRKFTEKALRDYANYGLRARDDGQYELGYNPSWESYNFRRVYYLWDALAAVPQTTLLLRAQNTYMYTQAEFEQRNQHLPSHVCAQTIADSSHLVPLENPAILAEQIQAWL